MIAQNFEYVVPTSVSDAVRLMKQYGDRAKVLAGGHSLIPMMKLRLAAPEYLIDLGKIPELSYIKEEDSTVQIGALTTHYSLETSNAVSRRFRALSEAAGLIGDVQVRNKGTIGGSLAHADPAADYPAPILALDATIAAIGPDGERQIPAFQFFVDILTTALRAGEIIREIRIPARSGRVGSSYLKMAQKASGFAICGAAAVVELDGSGKIAHAAVGITGVGSHAFRATQTEKLLRGQQPAPDLLKKAAEKAPDGVSALDDIHASADYRLDLSRIYARRAIEKAIERAG